MLHDTHNINVCVISEYWWSKTNQWHMPKACPPDPNSAHDSDDFRKHSHQGTAGTAKNIHHLSLHQALTDTFGQSRYLVQYAPTKLQRRLNHNILSHTVALEAIGGSVDMILAIVDVDDHQDIPGETEEERYSRVEAWWQDEVWKVERLQEDVPGVICYRSKNGYRLLGVMPEPMKLTCRQDAHVWTRQYTAWTNCLQRVYGMKSTGKTTPDILGDFTRFMRVPNDPHKSKLQAAQHLMLGNPALIGEWRLPLEDSDYPTVRTQSTARHQDTASDGCLLLELVRARGLRVEQSVGGAEGDWDICCPEWQRHSPDKKGRKDYPTKTRLQVGKLGSIFCMSDGCREKAHKPELWLSSFTKEEINAAEKALGREWKPFNHEDWQAREKLKVQRYGLQEKHGISDEDLELWLRSTGREWLCFEEPPEPTRQDCDQYGAWFAAQSEFEYPLDPQAWATFERSRRNWS